jgi:hypothetical protein
LTKIEKAIFWAKIQPTLPKLLQVNNFSNPNDLVSDQRGIQKTAPGFIQSEESAAFVLEFVFRKNLMRSTSWDYL